ncbi:MAG TPA: hypothetical protein VII92_13525 [Anaerolineae bacterium]
MAMQIDAANMPRDPYDVRWEPREVIERAHSGKPLRNTYRRVLLMFDDMTPADFNTLLGYDDGSSHTIRIPAPGSGIYTDYVGAYIRISRPAAFVDVHVEDIELEASWIVA